MSLNLDQTNPSSNDGSFKQQALPGWQPLLTPVITIGLLLFVSVIFLPIGIILLDTAGDLGYQLIRYDNNPDCTVTSTMNYTELPKICNVSFKIEQTMKPPIYFYYQLEEFYQNHRKYIKSKNDDQLQGTLGQDSNCEPLKENANDDQIVACGLIANSFFSDRFKMYVNGEDLCSNCINYGINNPDEWIDHWSDWHQEPYWSMKHIAWESDREEKFKYANISAYPNGNYSQQGYLQTRQGIRIPDTDNEDFIVWMRIAGLPNFIKLHRIIKDKTLHKGDNITVTILNWFPVREVSGQKNIVLATTSWAGTQNYGLAEAYISIGCICIVFAVIFSVRLLFGSRKLAEVDRFEWHNKPQAAPIVKIE